MDTKALRQKVLDLAIRGKLVPQNPDDEPPSVLLERIRAEKRQMVKDGKLKAKDIKNDTIIFRGEDNLHYEKFADGTVKCIEDEIPFEVPEGWEWARLNYICMMAAGKSKPTAQIMPDPFEGSFPCFGGNGIRGYVDKYNQDGTYSIIGRQGALCGNINVATGKFYATEHAVVTTLFSDIDFNWSNYILEALHLNKYATGAAQLGLSVANILNVFVPIPSTKEQQHIGRKISEIIEVIESIELQKQKLQRALLNTKSKILDLAIRGKLVPQDPNDEPASVLLERIRVEKEELIKQGKIKRDKKESVIFKGEDNSYYLKDENGVTDITDDLPFYIPDLWQWAKIKDILQINPRNSLENNLKVSFVPMLLIDNGYSGKHTDEVRLWKQVKSGFTHFKENDVGIAKITPCFENRKSTIFKNLRNGYGAGTTELHILRTYDDTILPQYLLAYIKSNLFIEKGKQNFIGVVGQQRIGRTYIENLYLPIPPLQEQQRIADQIDVIFTQLDAIISSLL